MTKSLLSPSLAIKGIKEEITLKTSSADHSETAPYKAGNSREA
jgi:hypothetical protein